MTDVQAADSAAGLKRPRSPSSDSDGSGASSSSADNKRPRNAGSSANSSGVELKRCAFVHLVMKGDSYTPGALVSAYSLRLTGTSAQLVCMVTPDVSADARKRLSVVFDKVVEVPYLTAHCLPLRTQKQRDMYNTWVDVAFTKWNAL